MVEYTTSPAGCGKKAGVGDDGRGAASFNVAMTRAKEKLI
jgi:hypothetical protein